MGPVFIDQSVNSDVYEGILEDHFLPAAADLGWLDESYWFQQDGAPPHTTRGNLEILRRNFGPNVIARKFPDFFDEGMAWPPYSPDFSPLDFFLWGYVKDKVYKKNPKTMAELRTSIENTINSIPADMLRRTMGSFENRLRMAIITKGQHIENIIH